MFDKSLVIPIGSDHGGYELKNYLCEKLIEDGYKIKDFGTYSAASVDYPDYIHPVARAINDGVYAYGIIMCGSGQGASMTANKYLNVRAGLCWDVAQAKLTRLHNNANIISLPGRFINFNIAMEAVKVFLNTDFEGGRHIPRIEKIPVKSNF
ncbi:MAG: ribose 5-phosphate isomerase B [Bacteroidales bacterium]|nr:ribose 5-phosphate isomerase B [Bacteroidales bacterium]